MTPDRSPGPPARYPRRLAILHWLIAAMVIGALVAGTFILVPQANDTPGKIISLRLHMSLGVAILVLMGWRLAVRLRGPLPPHAEAGHPALDLLARAAHGALYLLVFGMSLSGIALALMAGIPGVVFGGQGVLPADFDGYAPRAAHGLMASLLMAVIALHVAGAMYHHLVRRDGLLARMSPWRRPSP